MNRLGSQITDSGVEPQRELRFSERLANAISERKVEAEPENEIDTTIQESYGDMSENMTEAVDQDWGRPVDSIASYGSGYNISVETLTSGYILRVGCQTIAVESGDDVGKLIGLHLSDKTIGDKWMSSEKIVQKFLQESLQVK